MGSSVLVLALFMPLIYKLLNLSPHKKTEIGCQITTSTYFKLSVATFDTILNTPCEVLGGGEMLNPMVCVVQFSELSARKHHYYCTNVAICPEDHIRHSTIPDKL